MIVLHECSSENEKEIERKKERKTAANRKYREKMTVIGPSLLPLFYLSYSLYHLFSKAQKRYTGYVNVFRKISTTFHMCALFMACLKTKTSVDTREQH
jgi:hypothetical protein